MDGQEKKKKKKGTFPQIGIGQQPIGKITEKRQEVSKKKTVP